MDPLVPSLAPGYGSLTGGTDARSRHAVPSGVGNQPCPGCGSGRRSGAGGGGRRATAWCQQSGTGSAPRARSTAAPTGDLLGKLSPAPAGRSSPDPGHLAQRKQSRWPLHCHPLLCADLGPTRRMGISGYSRVVQVTPAEKRPPPLGQCTGPWRWHCCRASSVPVQRTPLISTCEASGLPAQYQVSWQRETQCSDQPSSAPPAPSTTTRA